MCVRQDTWVRRYLNRHCFVVRYCNLCGDPYYSEIAFAAHLIKDHDDRDLMLKRFVGRDSERAVAEWLNDPSPRPQDP